MPETPTSLVDTTTLVPLAELSYYYRNARRGDIPAIKRSLLKHRQYKPITANIGTLTGRRNEVLAGNHTLMAFRELATETDDQIWQRIKVHWGDWDEEQCRAINVADNRIPELGGYDNAELLSLLEDMSPLDLPSVGYDPADLAALRQSLYIPDRHTDPDDVPDLPTEAVTQPGQLWVLGDHRLLVGDCTDRAAVLRLCDGVPPDCVWTDPPYGVDYQSGLTPEKARKARRRTDGLVITNDSGASLRHLLRGAFGVAVEVCRPGAPLYVACPGGPQFYDFHSTLTEAGALWRATLIWVKSAMVLGRSDYHSQHEQILYGFTSGGKGRLGRGGLRWYGDNSQTTVFAFDKPARSAEHPTMKPVGLIEAMLANSCPPEGVVFDPFAGSGSTMIAAHSRGARCLAIEIDPRYADVILRRFEAHTKITPTLDGQPVSFLS